MFESPAYLENLKYWSGRKWKKLAKGLRPITVTDPTTWIFTQNTNSCYRKQTAMWAKEPVDLFLFDLCCKLKHFNVDWEEETCICTKVWRQKCEGRGRVFWSLLQKRNCSVCISHRMHEAEQPGKQSRQIGCSLTLWGQDQQDVWQNHFSYVSWFKVIYLKGYATNFYWDCNPDYIWLIYLRVILTWAWRLQLFNRGPAI